MKQKEKQDSAEQNPIKKGADRSETSSQVRHGNVGVAGGIKTFKSLPKAKADKSKETSSSSKNMEVSESLSDTMNNMSLAGETETSRDIKIKKARSKSNHKPEEWMLLDKESDTLSQLNLAIVSSWISSGYCTSFLLAYCLLTFAVRFDYRWDMLIPVSQHFQVGYCICWEKYLKSKCTSLRKKQSRR